MEIKRKNEQLDELHKELEKSRNITGSVLINVSKLSKSEEDGDTYSCIMMDQVNIKILTKDVMFTYSTLLSINS